MGRTSGQSSNTSSSNTSSTSSSSQGTGQGTGQGGSTSGAKKGGFRSTIVRFMTSIPGLRCHAIPTAGAHPEQGQGQVTSLDPTDTTIQNAVNNLADNRPPAMDASVQGQSSSNVPYAPANTHHTANYSTVGRYDPIIVTGHGASGRVHGGILPLPYNFADARTQPPDVFAPIFGHRTPQQLVDYLISHGLKKNFAGVIYLDGCYTGLGQSGSYAAEVYRLLVKKGYSYLQVKANLGESSTTGQGGEVITLPEGEQELEYAEAQKKRLTEELTEARKRMNASPEGRAVFQLQGDNINLENQIKQAKRRVPRDDAAINLLEAQLAASENKYRTDLESLRKQYGIPDLEDYVDFWTRHLERLEEKYEIPELVGTWGPEKPVHPHNMFEPR